MEPIKEEEGQVERALNVIKTKNEWVLYLQQVDTPNGFLILDSVTMNDIKDAIYLDNPIYSMSSISVCLQQCKKHLKNYINVNKNEKPFRIFH